MRGEVCGAFFDAIASAADGTTAAQIAGGDINDISAIALAAPHDFLSRIRAEPLKDGEPPETLADQIKGFAAHNNPPPKVCAIIIAHLRAECKTEF